MNRCVQIGSQLKEQQLFLKLVVSHCLTRSKEEELYLKVFTWLVPSISSRHDKWSQI